MWGWDWCRPVLTQGIWKKLEILGYDARIDDVGVLQSHQLDGSVHLEIHVAADGGTSGTHLEAQVSLANDVVAKATGPVENGEAILHTTVWQPQLWWPSGMGNQPLYVVAVQLKDAEGQSLDAATRRIGLRKVDVVSPSKDTALHLCVNGIPTFAKGADWISADSMPTRVTPTILRWYMSRAVESNFNFMARLGDHALV